MITVDKALTLLTDNIEPLEAERLSLKRALGRVAAKDVVAGVDLPPFAQSAMDGYALRADDVAEASDEAPVALELVGESAAGETGELPRVGSGEVARIFTGARVPPGADTVVRQERVEREGDRVLIREALDRGGDLRPVGEELSADAQLVEAGTRLDERHIAALSMTGHPEAVVRRQPHIVLLVSGDEVVSPGIELRPGEVYDANTPLLRGWLSSRGYSEVEVLHLEDERRVVRRALDDALERADLVVSTGGVSVGEYDFLVDVAEEVGLETVFWKLRQKPGKPLLFARRDKTPFLGIPGNPGAVFVSAYVYLRRALDLLDGVATPGPAMNKGRLTDAVRPSSSKLKWTGCHLDFDAEGCAQLTPDKGHRLSQLYRCDALARIDAGDERLEAGTIVDWLAL